MNYIEQINHYWQLREQGMITGPEGELYLYLLHTSNKLNWKNPFNQSNRLICAFLDISEKSLIKYRNNLKQVGLISFESGKAIKSNTSYCIHSSSSGSRSGSSLDSSSGSRSGSSLDQNRSDNYKHKQNNDDDNVVKHPSSLPFITIDRAEQILDFENEYGMLATRQTSKSVSDLKAYKLKFIGEQRALSRTWPNEPDLKKHFISWVKKQPSIQSTSYLAGN